MIRFSSKILKLSLNQITSKLSQRNISNVQNQLISKLQKQNIVEISKLVNKINQEQFQQKLPSIYQNNEISDKHKNPTIGNYNNVFDDILNYRKIYIENIGIPINAPEKSRSNNEVIQAARLIVIRRRKIKKHKLKKLRKKMKFEWAKVRQRREMRKEKAFQAVLIKQIKEAEKFSAAEYVELKLKQANEVPIPRFWKGKRLPQFIIKQKLGIK